MTGAEIEHGFFLHTHGSGSCSALEIICAVHRLQFRPHVDPVFFFYCCLLGVHVKWLMGDCFSWEPNQSFETIWNWKLAPEQDFYYILHLSSIYSLETLNNTKTGRGKFKNERQEWETHQVDSLQFPSVVRPFHCHLVSTIFRWTVGAPRILLHTSLRLTVTSCLMRIISLSPLA